MSAEAVCVKQELEGEHGETSARVEAPQLMDPVLMKEEPEFEPEYEELSCVKEEPWSELYADHVVKDELVLGPERPHRPTGGYVVQDWAPCDADGCLQAPEARGRTRVTLRDCCVRLERLLSHEAMPPHTEHRETGQKDTLTTYTDSESELEDKTYKSTKLDSDEYTCVMCKEAFSVKEDLLKHVAVHIHIPRTDPEATSDVEDCSRAPRDADGCPQAAGVRAGARRVTLRDCSVRLERLLHHEAMPPHTEHPETGQGDVLTTHTDNQSSAPSGAGHETPTQATDANTLQGQGSAETSVYICDLCGHLYELKHEMIRHFQEHRQHKYTSHKVTYTHIQSHIQVNIEMFTCKICKNKYKDKSTLKRHGRIHTGEKPYSCEICNRSFSRRDHLKVHLRTHVRGKPYSCEISKKRYTSSTDLKIHNRNHSGEQHHSSEISINHSNDKRYYCDLCKKEFRRLDYLQVHIRSHTGERPYCCDICGKRFKGKVVLKAHKRTHTGERPYTCEVCKKTFPRRSNLQCHLRSHSGDKPYLCEICKKTFPQRSNLKYHLKSHSGDKPYLCEICKKTFPQRSNLKYHLKSHSGDKPYLCEICKKGFKGSSYLKIHIRSHTGERPYFCEICKKRFTLSSNLKQHIRSHFFCKMCKKEYTGLSNFNTHLCTHIGEYLFSCDICKKKFKRLKYLTKHKRTHTEERPYSCLICEKKFKQRTHLKSHLRTHTG